MTEELDPLPLSALNHLMFCERRCALIHIEGVFEEHAFTLQGSLLHDAADTPGYETRSGVRTVRALPIYSRRLGLPAKPTSSSSRARRAAAKLPVPSTTNGAPVDAGTTMTCSFAPKPCAWKKCWARKSPAAQFSTPRPSGVAKSSSRRR